MLRLQDINIEQCQQRLAPRNARFANGEFLKSTPLMPVQEVQIVWGKFTSISKDVMMYRDFLRYFTWPTNADNATQTKRFVEGDSPDRVAFTVKGVDFYGRWRQAKVDIVRTEVNPNEIEFWLVLTLRNGYLQSLAWDEAEVIEHVKQNDAGNTPSETALVRFYNVDPFVQKAVLASGLGNTNAFTNPAIGGETWTGVWASSAPRSVRNLEDGSAIVEVKLARTFALTAPTTSATIKADLKTRTYYVRKHDNQIVNLFSVSTFEEDTLFVEVPNFPANDATWKALMVTLTDADIATEDTVPTAIFYDLPDTGFGWSYLNRSYRENEDGTATFFVALQKRAFNQYAREQTEGEAWETIIAAPTTRDRQFKSDGTTQKTEAITFEWIRVDQTRLDLVRAAAEEIKNYREYDDAGEVGTWDLLSTAEDSSGWKVKSVHVRRQGNGGADLVATIANEDSSGWLLLLWPSEKWQEQHDYPDRIIAKKLYKRYWFENHHLYYGFTAHDVIAGVETDMTVYTAANAVPSNNQSGTTIYPTVDAEWALWKQSVPRRVDKGVYEVHVVYRVNQSNYQAGATF